MKSKTLKTMVFTALFMAIICVTTYTFKIPVGNGYIHIGDSMIYLASNILPFPFGMIAGGLGGALSDALGGYWQYVIPTMIIKSINSLCFYMLKTRGEKIISTRCIIATVLSSLVTVVGYYFVSVILYGWAGSLATIAGNLVQACGAFIVFVVVGLAFDKTTITRRIKV